MPESTPATRRSRRRGRAVAARAGAIAALTSTIVLHPVALAWADDDQGGWTSVPVGRSCTAPTTQVSNGCSITGTATGPDGAPIAWQVDLFSNDLWRIQFQAFSESVVQECQYPIRIKGSYGAPDGRATRFVLRRGAPLDLTPAESPTLTLTVSKVRIDTEHPTCSG